MKKNKKQLKKIGIVAYPSTPENPGLTKLISIVKPSVFKLTVISGNYQTVDLDKNIVIKNVRTIPRMDLISKILNFILFQIITSYFLIKFRNSFDVVLFHVGTTQILPNIISRLLGKKTILIFSGSSSDTIKYTYNRSAIVFFNIIYILERISILTSTKIITYSPKAKTILKLQDNNKVYSWGALYIDNVFDCTTSIQNRSILGYVGRFSPEKGVMNFVDAIPDVLEKYPNSKFMLIGDGPLKNEINTKINSLGIKRNVEIINWVSRKDINSYLNQIKIIIIPSYTDAGPQILLEAMATGTICLSADVGIVSDVIKNNFNGFILRENTPKEISNAITKILKSNELDSISSNAVETIKTFFTKDSAIKRYKKILNDTVN